MSVRTACPFCNAWTVLPDPTSERLVCLRCGESFIPGAWEATTDATRTESAAFVSSYPKRALIVSTLAALLAVAAALAVYKPWQTLLKPTPEPERVAAVHPPLSLTGLRYLP